MSIHPIIVIGSNKFDEIFEVNIENSRAWSEERAITRKKKNNSNDLGALDTWRSRDLRSAECAGLTTRILHNSPLQSVTGVWKLSEKKSKWENFWGKIARGERSLLQVSRFGKDWRGPTRAYQWQWQGHSSVWIPSSGSMVAKLESYCSNTCPHVTSVKQSRSFHRLYLGASAIHSSCGHTRARIRLEFRWHIGRLPVSACMWFFFFCMKVSCREEGLVQDSLTPTSVGNFFAMSNCKAVWARRMLLFLRV